MASRAKRKLERQPEWFSSHRGESFAAFATAFKAQFNEHVAYTSSCVESQFIDNAREIAGCILGNDRISKPHLNWHTSRDGAAMLRRAVDMGVDRRLIVLAACKIARAVLRLSPSWQRAKEPLRLIRKAEAWTRGGPCVVLCESVAILTPMALAARACADLTRRVDDLVAIIVGHLTNALLGGSGLGYVDTGARIRDAYAYCANVIREVIPYPRAWKDKQAHYINVAWDAQKQGVDLPRPFVPTLLDWAPHCLVYRTAPERLGLQLGLPYLRSSLAERINARASGAAPLLWIDGPAQEVVESIPDGALASRIAKWLEEPQRFGRATIFAGDKEIGTATNFTIRLALL